MILNESMFNDFDEWVEVDCKSVEDSDGFMTDYTWYTNGKRHIFIFGDQDIYKPEDSYPDWEVEIYPGNEQNAMDEAQEWFDNYHGFAELGDDFEMVEGFFDNSVGKLDVSEAERAMKYHTVTYSTQIFELLNRRYDVVGLKSRGDDSTGSILIKGLKKDITRMLNKKLAPIGSYDKVEFRKQVDGLYTFELSSDVETDTTQTNAQELKGKEYLDSATDAYLVSSLDKSKYSNKQLTEKTEQELVASQKKKFAEYQEKLNEVNKKIEELLDKKRKYDNAKPEEKKFMDSIGYLDGVKSSMSDYEQKQKHYMKEMEVLDQLIKNGGNYKVEVEDPKLVSEGLEDKSLETLCANYNFICNELTVDELNGFGIDELMNMYEGDVKYFCVDTGDGQQVVVAVSSQGNIMIEEDTDYLGFGIGDEYKNAEVFIKDYLKKVGREQLEEALPAIAVAAITAAASGAGARLVDKVFGESVESEDDLVQEYISKSTISELAAEVAAKAKKVFKLDAYNTETLEHDINNLRAHEWVDLFNELPKTSKLKKLFFDNCVKLELEEKLTSADIDTQATELVSRMEEALEFTGNRPTEVEFELASQSDKDQRKLLQLVNEKSESKYIDYEIEEEKKLDNKFTYYLIKVERKYPDDYYFDYESEETLDVTEPGKRTGKYKNESVESTKHVLTERYLSGRYIWCEYKDIVGMNIYQLCKYVEELYKKKFSREVKVFDLEDQSYDYRNKELPFIVVADMGDEESVKGCDGFWFLVNCTEDEAKKLTGETLTEAVTDGKAKYVYFFPYVGSRELTKEKAISEARNKLDLMESSNGASEVGQGFAIYCSESFDGEEKWTARNNPSDFLKSLKGLSEGKFKEIAIEIESDGGYDNWAKNIYEKIDAIKEEMKEFEKDARRGVNNGGNLDSEDIKEELAEFAKQIDSLLNKLKAVKEK